MPPLAVILAVFVLAVSEPDVPLDGRIVDARSGAAVAGAEITIVGRRGSVRTDGEGGVRTGRSLVLSNRMAN